MIQKLALEIALALAGVGVVIGMIHEFGKMIVPIAIAVVLIVTAASELISMFKSRD